MTGFFVGLMIGFVAGFCIVLALHDYDPKADKLIWRHRK